MTSLQGEEVSEPVVPARPKGRAAGVPGDKAHRGIMDVACPVRISQLRCTWSAVEDGLRATHIKNKGELCDSCLAEKQRRLPFPKAAKYRAKDALELVHDDLCGPITPATNGGRRYFLLLVDDRSRYMWLQLLMSKDEAAVAIKKFKTPRRPRAARSSMY